MNIALLLILSGVILLTGYFTYGRFVARKLKINDQNTTPAHTLRDGIDYEPGRPFVVLGHHFASIAGAGPIVGPIIAVVFGWIPAVIWILVGGIFIGAVHDLTSMIASMRHQGKSIGHIIQMYIGTQGKRLFLAFGLATLILIIAVFADIIAKTFVNNPGVASSSFFFILIAIVFGFVNKRYPQRAIFLFTTIIGVILMFGFVFLGSQWPLTYKYPIWIGLLMAYSFVASVTPVSFLLQPRDYLSSFLLYGLMILSVTGIFVGNPQIRMSNEVHFTTQNFGYLFPVLFVTIACGAISGFHSLVSSGTTSKQVDRESNARVIGYGGMLIESFLAVIAIASVIIISRSEYITRLPKEGPVSIFAGGLGGIIASLGFSTQAATTFVALTVSAFALTTLDTCTRLARFCFQEFMEDVRQPVVKKVGSNRYVATTIVVFFSVLLLTTGGFSTLWPIFGSANQLLAALSFLAVSVWLSKEKVNLTFILIPTILMFGVTFSSLILFAWSSLKTGSYGLSTISVLLLIMSLFLLLLTKRSLQGTTSLETSEPVLDG